QGTPGEDTLALHDFTVTGELVEVLVEAGLQAGGKGPYNVHGWLLVHTCRLVATSAEVGATQPLEHSSSIKLCMWGTRQATPQPSPRRRLRRAAAGGGGCVRAWVAREGRLLREPRDRQG